MNSESGESAARETDIQKMSTKLRGGKPPTTPGYLEVLFIVAIAATAVIYGYDHFFACKIVVLDAKGYLREQKVLLTAGEITEEQWKAGLDKLGQVLEHQPANQIVLLKEVVLKNGREISIK